MNTRQKDLAHKAWSYLLEAFQEPTALPVITWTVGIKRVHIGEILKLYRHRHWLRNAMVNTVIDIGAHTGEFASAISVVVPEAQIYAFEPLPDCHAKLSRRLRNHTRFRSFCVALGNRREQVAFHQSAFSEASSVLPMSTLHKRAFPWSTGCTQLTVHMSRLDDFLHELVLAPSVLLKIDVQGYECEVLKGARRALERVHYVLVETSFEPLYEGQALFRDVFALMTDQGFEYGGSLDQLWSPIDGGMLQADALFVKAR